MRLKEMLKTVLFKTRPTGPVRLVRVRLITVENRTIEDSCLHIPCTQTSPVK